VVGAGSGGGGGGGGDCWDAMAYAGKEGCSETANAKWCNSFSVIFISTYSLNGPLDP
jgi:hypothetical protein